VPKTLQGRATNVLRALAVRPLNDTEISAEKLSAVTGLQAEELSETVEFLKGRGFANFQQYAGSAPFRFSLAWVTPEGRRAYETIRQK